MSIKRLNRNDITRGRIMDEIAEYFGNSVLGLYDKKLRVEIIDDDGNVIQFSVAPVVHKDLVEPEECDEYIPTDEKVRIYEDSLKKNTTKSKKTKSSKEQEDKVISAAKTVVNKS